MVIRYLIHNTSGYLIIFIIVQPVGKKINRLLAFTVLDRITYNFIYVKNNIHTNLSLEI